jgi:hypothetical protein
MPSRVSEAARGAAAGVLATLPMTVHLVLMERTGVMRGQPPRMMVDHLLPRLPRRGGDVLALIAHFGFGAASGAVTAALAGSPRVRHPVVTGIGAGLAVWASAYEGWVPLVGILPPAHRDHRGRAATMLTAHVVFGLVLGRLLWARR